MHLPSWSRQHFSFPLHTKKRNLFKKKGVNGRYLTHHFCKLHPLLHSPNKRILRTNRRPFMRPYHKFIERGCPFDDFYRLFFVFLIFLILVFSSSRSWVWVLRLDGTICGGCYYAFLGREIRR
jgi:hypothetical protein